MKKSALIAWVLFLSLFVIASSATAAEMTLFGPKQYMRTSGGPNVYSDTFQGALCRGKLIVRNGNSDGGRRVEDAVSSATVSLNGVQIFGPSDFNKQVYYLEAEVNLAESNSISATLASSPDSYLTIEVTRTAPPAIRITNPVNNSTISSETPEITINYTNDEAGIDLASLSVKIDDIDHSADFTATDSKAKWRVTSPFLPGAHAISASISDPKGNVGTAVSNFTVAPSSQSIRYLFSVADNDWIFASPGDGTYREYLSGEDLGLFDAVDVVSLSEVLPNGDLFFTLSGQGGIFRSPADGSNSRYLGNAQLGLQDSDRILGLHIGLDGSVFFAAKGEPHIWASLGLSTRSLYLDQLARLGIDDSFQIECLHIGYDGTIYFCFSGGEGVYYSSGNGAYGQFLTPGALGVPGSVIDGFSLVPDANAPGITVTDPPNGATLATRTPTIKIAFSDLESGLNLGSFAVTVNGEDWTSRFSVTSSEATYQVADPLPVGANVITAQIKDNVGNSNSAVSNFTVSPPQPTVGISASPESIPYGGSATLAWSSTDATSVTIEPGIGPVPPVGSVTVSPGQTTPYTITATGPGGTVTAHITVTVTTANVEPLPEGSFGEQYQDLIPPDATVGSYDPKRFSLITGLVQDLAKAPIADVSVSILEYPKYGTALTDSNGRFSIPMDGGATYTVLYKKAGLIPSQRKVYVPWNDTAVAPTIQMIAEDPASTTVTFNGDPATIVTHQSTPFTDEFGSRSCTMVFQGDNRAYEVDAQGNVVRELTAITTRATEFTTPESMPAVLPPNSAYTYCAELSVDGVQRVKFDKPVIAWVNNFLGFPVGAVVPVGYYDRDRGVWVPSDNGVVVQLLDTNGDGIVDALDATGSGQPTDLNGNGSFSDEVSGLGDPAKYPPGSTFWRFAVSHFTPWDGNYPYGPPAGAIPPNGGMPSSSGNPKDGNHPCLTPGCSSVADRSGTFHEDIPIPGTDMTLHYASDRVAGYHYGITVPASGSTVPASLEKIIVRVEVAGRTLEQVLDPQPEQVAQFLWDGLDQLGRRVVGSIPAHIKVGFVYKAVYYLATSNDRNRAFAQAGTNVTGIRARQELISWKESDIVVSKPTIKGKDVIAEGWTLSAHHSLSPGDPSTLYKGDGTTNTNNTSIITTVAGNGFCCYSGDGGPAVNASIYAPSDVAVDAAGNLYIADSGNARIRKVDTNGIITTVAGCGRDCGYQGDGGLATNVELPDVSGVAVDAAGNLYIADSTNHRIRKLDTSGIITTIAGNGTQGYSGDGGPAVNAQLNLPYGLALDAAGNLYIAEYWNDRIRKVDTSGIITTVAGGGSSYGDGGPAVNAQLYRPTGVALDAVGNLYIADDYHHRVRKVDTSGIITTVAGNGQYGYAGDGGLAIDAQFYVLTGVTVDAGGNLYIADNLSDRVRKVDTSGIITTVAGTGVQGYSGDGGPALNASVDIAGGRVAVDAAGNLYIADGNNRVRKVGSPSTFAAYATAGEIPFSDENGLGYIMSSAGLHKKTIDLNTGVVLREFGYNSNDELISITDRFGNETLIERGGDGVPTAIVSPDGIRTGLTVDANNHLKRITYPDQAAYVFEYTPDGLLKAKVEPETNRFDHVFNTQGRLTDALDEEGGHWVFDRTAQENGDIVTTVTTGESNLTSYLDHSDSTGAYTSTITDPTGGQTLYSESADGLTVSKSLPCGMNLSFKYGLDSEYKFKYVKEMRERTQAALERVTLRSKTYQDTNSDNVKDLITETLTVNGKATNLVTNTLQGKKTITSPVGRSVTALYDPSTLLTTSLSIPGLLDTTYGYDPKGRLQSITTGSRQTTFHYDPQGNLDSITDPLSHTTTYAHDPVGRLTRIDRPGGGSIGFDYDKNGNMTVLTNPATISHGFGYNKVNLNSSYATPLSGSYGYIYDKDRRLKQVNFPSGKQINNVYANGRLEEIQTPEGTIDLTYLCSTKVDSITKGTERIAYGYDGSLVTSEALSGTLNGSIAYGYNSDFNLTSLNYAGGTVNLGYDNDGLLTSAGSYTITRNTGNGLPEAVTGGALSLARSFNGYGEVEGQGFTVGGQGVTSWSLTRDDSGRIRTKTETVAGASSTYAYTCDPMGRLRTVTRDGALIEEYQYDPVTGIRSYETNTLRGISGRSYTYSNEDHLLSAGATTYQYSLDGFLTNKTNGANQTSYVYSSRGELLRVDPPDGRVIEYVHDPLGRRIAKKVNGAITEKYLWQGLTRLLAIYDGSDSLLMRFQYADARMPVAMTRGGTTYYLTYDQVGSLRAVADASGNVVKRIDYDSFGIIINDSDPSFAVPFGFAGGLHDRDTGLVRFGFRDYDSDVGRWLAKDPIGFLGGGADLYAYCLSDPVNLVDPLGRGVRGAAMGAAVGMAVGVVLGTGETALTGGLGVVAAPAIVAASAATFALAGHLGEELGLAIGGALDDLLTKASLANPCAKQHSPDRRALNELIDEVTQGGRRPLSESDADAVLDWADELGIQGARDDRATDHWEKGPHIHVPGSGISHIPAR